jgi:hypothetical protein
MEKIDGFPTCLLIGLVNLDIRPAQGKPTSGEQERARGTSALLAGRSEMFAADMSFAMVVVVWQSVTV